MDSMTDTINKNPLLKERAKYARIWLEKFAPESEKFSIKEQLPSEAGQLNNLQRELLIKITKEIEKKWEPEKFQMEIYNWGKELGINSTQTFQAIYLPLLGKNHGPKAAWLILSLDKEFVKKRFQEAKDNK